jgi:hypothetical protein
MLELHSGAARRAAIPLARVMAKNRQKWHK